MQVQITKIVRKTVDKDNKPLVTRDGRPYTRVAIQTKEHGAKYLSGFENFTNKNWKEGDLVEIEVEEKGEYLNFKNLSQTDKLWNAYNDLLKRVVKMEQVLTKGSVPVDEIVEDNDELPF
jgi:hypothetical protein